MSLKFSSFGHLDDPQEYKKWTHATGTGERTTSDDMFKAMKGLRKALDNCRVGCFSLNNDGSENIIRKGFAKSRMWSQYAEGHCGICLAFSKEKLVKQIEENLEDNELILCKDKVEYRLELSAFQGISHIDVNEYMKGSGNYLSEHLSGHAQESFFKKQLDYQQELEYRIVVKSLRDIFYAPINKSLTGIILGDRFDIVYLPSIKKILAEEGIEIPIIKLDYNRGDVIFINL